MNDLTIQMQDRMNNFMTGIRLEAVLKQVHAQMIAAAERIEKRPAVKGCNALKRTQSHSVVQNSKDNSSLMVSAAIGVPGLEDTVDMAINVAEQLYSDSKTAQKRTQDNRSLSPKQQAKIRHDNDNDLALFLNLEQRAMALQAYASCGVTHVDIIKSTDEIRPSGLTPKDRTFEPKLSPKDEQELARNLSFRPTHSAPSGMRPS